MACKGYSSSASCWMGHLEAKKKVITMGKKLEILKKIARTGAKMKVADVVGVGKKPTKAVAGIVGLRGEPSTIANLYGLNLKQPKKKSKKRKK